MHQFFTNIFSSMQTKNTMNVCVCVCVCMCVCEGERGERQRHKERVCNGHTSQFFFFLIFAICFEFQVPVRLHRHGQAPLFLVFNMSWSSHLSVTLRMTVNFLILRPVVYVINIKFKIKYFFMLYFIINVNVSLLSVHYLPILWIQ